jgi:hypothetical protein
MDAKTFITVQGQCRKLCIETEIVQVATRDGLKLEEAKLNIPNVWLHVRLLLSKW